MEIIELWESDLFFHHGSYEEWNVHNKAIQNDKWCKTSYCEWMQKLWNGAQAAGDHNGAHSWPIIPCKQQGCEQKLCFSSEGTLKEKKNHTSLDVTKWATVKLKMIKFILKISTGTMVQHFYEPRPKRKWSSCIHANTFTCILHKC